MKVGVIGAGPAGMTVATILSQNGVTVDVYEAADHVGGLARSIELWGQIVDLGPHRFFSSDRRVNSFWLGIAGTEYRMVDRLTRIYYRDQFFHYPLRPSDVLLKFGFSDSVKSVFSFLNQQALAIFRKTNQEESFESWVTKSFGKHLFEIFFKSYSEKLWGRSCDQIDADFARQRIKGLSLYQAVRSALPFLGSGNRLRTLVDEFAYPLNGTGSIYAKMAEETVRNGGTLHLNSPIKRVCTVNNQVTGLVDAAGNINEYSHVVSTMPLTHLVDGVEGAPKSVKEAAALLRFRNTILVYLQVNGENPFPDNWIYINSQNVDVGRITNFRNWIPEICGGRSETILCLEYWCEQDDSLWSTEDDDLVSFAKQELKLIKLVQPELISAGHVVRIPRSYPIYEVGYKKNIKLISEYLNTIRGLSVIGRYGSFKYNNQDHSILMGILAAENILSGKDHDLWSVNTDYENYAEGAYITETGLV